jgi:hypothetical protein
VVTLRWDPSIFGFVLARSFAVYRAEGAVAPDPRTLTASSDNLLGRSFAPEYVDAPGGTGPYHYVVTSLSGNSAESGESNLVTVEGLNVSTETQPQLPALETFPNPFRRQLLITGPSGEVSVFDLLGRAVWRSESSGQVTWTPVAALASGVYLIRFVDVSGRQAVTSAVLAR